LSASFSILARLNDGKTRLAPAKGRRNLAAFIEKLDTVLLDAGPLSPAGPPAGPLVGLMERRGE
jgi:hypothetical protein